MKTNYPKTYLLFSYSLDRFLCLLDEFHVNNLFLNTSKTPTSMWPDPNFWKWANWAFRLKVQFFAGPDLESRCRAILRYTYYIRNIAILVPFSPHKVLKFVHHRFREKSPILFAICYVFYYISREIWFYVI